MNNLPISSMPQPSAPIAGGTQPDGMAGTADNGQASSPFAQVLARKVDQPASSDTNSGEQATGTDSASPVPEQAVVPVDALNAILAQIPVETRGATVTDRAALLATGSQRAAGIDPATAQFPGMALTPAITTDKEASNGIATSGFNLPAGATTGNTQSPAVTPSDANNPAATPAKTDATVLASEQQILEDAQLQALSGRQEPTSTQPLPGAASSATSATTIAQSIAAAMPNMPMDTRSNVNTQVVSTPLTSPAWPDDFSQKVSWMISQRNQVAELHLNPPNLGPLDIVLKVSDNQATALFASPHAAVRDAVENALPKLRELLADNGIMLSNATVGDQSPRDQGMQQFADRQAGMGTGRDSENGASEAAGAAAAPVVRRHDGIVDTYA